MPAGQRLYVGPSLRRIRRDRGLTQSDMAADLDVSPSYIALLERNHRPLSAELLLRLAQTYQIDMSTLADTGSDDAMRLQTVLKDPLFADIELPSLETTDVVTNFPGIAEAFLRLYTAYQEEHMALADRGAEAHNMPRGAAGAGKAEPPDPVAESRRFLAARRNCFPLLDDAAERLAHVLVSTGGDRARIEHHQLGGGQVARFPQAPRRKQCPESRAVGLRRAAAELCNVKGRHVVVKMIAGRSGARKVLARGWRRAFVRALFQSG